MILPVVHTLSHAGCIILGLCYPIFETYHCAWCTFSGSQNKKKKHSESKRNSKNITTSDDSEEEEINLVVVDDEWEQELKLMQKKWLSYWFIYFLYTYIIDFFFGSMIVERFAFYNEFKLIFILFLLLPQSSGAQKIFDHLISPLFSSCESEVDEKMNSFKTVMYDYAITYAVQAKDFVSVQIKSFLAKRLLEESDSNTSKNSDDHNNKSTPHLGLAASAVLLASSSSSSSQSSSSSTKGKESTK